MKRAEWSKPDLSPLGTPQFSVSKDTSFPNYDTRHTEALIPLANKQISFKDLSNPAGKKSETIASVLKLRNLLEENLTKIRKSYLARERDFFQLIGDEDELKVLIATRPAALEIPSRVKAGKGRFIDDYRSGFGKKGGVDEKRVWENEKRKLEERKDELVQDLEGFLQEKVEESKRVVEEYWADKVGELEEKLMEIESEREWSADRKEELIEEIEKRVREEFEGKRKERKVKSLTKKEKEGLIMKLQAELEIEQIQELDNEKAKWIKEDLKQVQELCREKLKDEHENLLQKKEKELKKQAETEMGEVITRLIKDTEEVISQKLQTLSTNKESAQSHLEDLLKQESSQEFLEDLQADYKFHLHDRLKHQLEKDIKKSLSQRIEMELKIRLEDQIFSSLNQTFEDSHEIFRKKVEQEQTQKLIELEYLFESTRSQELKASVSKRFSKTEKDLKINYLKKLDKLKSDSRKEFEEIYIGQIKKIRTLLIQEKSEAARIKSQINVYVNKTSEEKASEIRSLQYQEELLGKKIRDISFKQQIDFDQSQFKPTPDTSKSPLRKSNSGYSPLMQMENRTIPKPLPPPSFEAFEDVKKKSPSPERRLLKIYDTKEIANSLILKNYEEAHRQAWTTLKETEEPLKPKSTYAEISELLSTGKTLYKRDIPKKHSLYNELLKKKYGVIEPRVK